MDEKKNSAVVTVGIIVIIVAVAVYIGFKYFNGDEVVTTEAQTSDTPVTRKEDITPSETVYSYKDGNYSAVGNYVSPNGAEQVKVTLTLKNDIVTDVALTPLATFPVSLKFQNIVAANVKALVVGKKISEVTLDKVSGSSLTPIGFNDAVAKIKVQAKA